MLRLNRFAAGCALVGLTFISAAARAATLIGDTMSVELDGPLFGTVICSSTCFSPTTFTVVAGQISTSFILGGKDIADFFFSDNSVTYKINQTYTSGGSAIPVGGFSNAPVPAAQPFYGFVFTVISGNLIPPVVGGSGNRQGTGNEFLYDSGGILAENFGNADFLPGDTGTGIFATTPLPAALPLFATGLGALGLLGWRRKKKAAGLATTQQHTT